MSTYRLSPLLLLLTVLAIAPALALAGPGDPSTGARGPSAADGDSDDRGDEVCDACPIAGDCPRCGAAADGSADGDAAPDADDDGATEVTPQGYLLNVTFAEGSRVTSARVARALRLNRDLERVKELETGWFLVVSELNVEEVVDLFEEAGVESASSREYVAYSLIVDRMT